jgi:hypothetical protein
VRSTHRRVPFAWLLASALLAGCGGPSATTVGGTVELDGQPLETGTIQFAATDGQAPSQAAMIAGGRYQTELQRTEYQVQIFSPKPSARAGKIDPNVPGGEPTVEERLPPRYNFQSQLKLKVSGPTADAHFKLQSKLPSK